MADFPAEEYPPAGPEAAVPDGYSAEQYPPSGPEAALDSVGAEEHVITSILAMPDSVPAEIPDTCVGALAYYHMYALDLNALPAIVYREWTVTGAGDFTAAQYTGPFSGATINFGFIVVLNTFLQ